MKSLRMKIALEKYVNGEFSLCRAAEFAEVSIQQMARCMTDRGIAYFRQSIEESKRDVKEAEGFLERCPLPMLSGKKFSEMKKNELGGIFRRMGVWRTKNEVLRKN